MNKVGTIGHALKKQRLEAKLAKIKRQILMEFETEALQSLQEILDGKGSTLEAEFTYQIADCFYQLRRYRNCILVLDSALNDQSRKMPRIQNLKGQCYMKLGELDKAIDHFEVCLVIDPNFKVAHNNLGNIYMQKKDYNKCRIYYEQSKRCNPDLTSFRETSQQVCRLF